MVNAVIIDINHLTFGYDSDCTILHDIDLHLKGEGLICIIGPNGVGKSTLVRCVNGLLKPDSGNVMIDGRDLSDMTAAEIAEIISFVPATTSIAFPMSVVDSILIALNRKDRWHTSSEDLAKAYLALDVMRMRDLALRNCNELSAGQIQKVALCRGLVRDSELLVLDEPTANLDIKHQIFVSDFMHELSKANGSMILMISHDLNLAARYANTVIVMSKPGVIYDVGSPQDVITEKMIRDVYDVDAEVVTKEGIPYVFLRNALNW